MEYIPEHRTCYKALICMGGEMEQVPKTNRTG